MPEITKQEWSEWLEERCTQNLIEKIHEGIIDADEKRIRACEEAVFGKGDPQIAWRVDAYSEALNAIIDYITGEL